MKESEDKEFDKLLKKQSFKILEDAYERSQVVCNPVQFSARQQTLLQALADYVVECARQEHGVEPLNSSELLPLAHHRSEYDQLDF